MQVDENLISYLEDLSFLTLSNDEKNQLKKDFENILNGLARLGELNTDGVNERSHPFDNVNVFREDKANPSFGRELILKNAPVRNDEMFVAPRTIE